MKVYITYLLVIIGGGVGGGGGAAAVGKRQGGPSASKTHSFTQDSLIYHAFHKSPFTLQMVACTRATLHTHHNNYFHTSYTLRDLYMAFSGNISSPPQSREIAGRGYATLLHLVTTSFLRMPAGAHM